MEIFIYIIGFSVATFAIYSSFKKENNETTVNISQNFKYNEIFNDRRNWFINSFMKEEKKLLLAQTHFRREMIFTSLNDYSEKIRKIQNDSRSVN